MGNGKTLADFTGKDVAQLVWLAEPDLPLLKDINTSMEKDGLDWATAVCLVLVSQARH